MSDPTRRQLQAAADRASAVEAKAWEAVVATKQAVSEAIAAHTRARLDYERAQNLLLDDGIVTRRVRVLRDD